jgi:tetratricopeptide (TPR) repeat protein
MRYDKSRLALILMLGTLTAGQMVLAQPPVIETNVSSSPLYRGEELFQSGSFLAAAEVFQQADGLDTNEGIVGASRAYVMLGNYAAAIAVCEDAISGEDYAETPLVSTQLAEVYRLVGRSAEALSLLKAVIDGPLEPPVRTLVQYGSLLQFVGQRTLALESLNQAVQRYDDGLVFASEDVAMVALASWLLGQFHDANASAPEGGP